MKEYKAVAVSPTLIREKKSNDSAARYLGEVINSEAQQGWDYHSMEKMTQADKKGCFGGTVDSDTIITYYVAIFERDVNEL